MNTETLIDALFVGRAKPLGNEGQTPVLSGIVKQRQEAALRLSFDGLEGDEQADLRFHGGPEKAVHHYPGEHYGVWRSIYPASAVPLVPGAFGENLSTVGMTEKTVCIGDVYRTGSVLLQVSQGRQPCWKLNRLLNAPDAAVAMQTSGATGWYYRVLAEGALSAGEPLALVDRPCPAWTMERLIGALFPPDPSDPGLMDEWRQASSIRPLAARWQNTFAQRVRLGTIEEWAHRLYEP